MTIKDSFCFKFIKIQINSLEYQCWHEVGHAIVCLHLGGNVEFIEFVDNQEAKGIARARCETTPGIKKYVVCGGFATEYILYKKGYLSNIDERKFTQIVFKNATIDRKMFFNRSLKKDEDFTRKEDEEFMHFAIDYVSPIISPNLMNMKKIVGELAKSRKIEGFRIKEIMN